MSHTPGPWRSVYDGSSDWSIGEDEDPQANRIAGVRRRGGLDTWQEAADNARLIAAAPELLDALKRILAGFEANVFQRNTAGDEESGWAVKFLPHLMALADATRAIEKAEPTEVGLSGAK